MPPTVRILMRSIPLILPITGHSGLSSQLLHLYFISPTSRLHKTAHYVPQETEDDISSSVFPSILFRWSHLINSGLGFKSHKIVAISHPVFSSVWISSCLRHFIRPDMHSFSCDLLIGKSCNLIFEGL